MKFGLHSHRITHKVCKIWLQKSVLVAEHHWVYIFLIVHTEIAFPARKKRDGGGGSHNQQI